MKDNKFMAELQKESISSIADPASTPPQKTQEYRSRPLKPLQSFQHRSSPSKYDQLQAMSNSQQTITNTKGKLNDLIEDLNGKLLSHFHSKQQNLLNQYKQELVQAQKDLNDLKNQTNQEEIRNKMIDRKKQLERERHNLIQTNIYFSNKCEDYKKKLTNLINEGKQLEKEIAFLDTQLESANRSKLEIADHLQSRTQPLNQELPLESDYKGRKTHHESTNVQKPSSIHQLSQLKMGNVKKNLLKDSYTEDTASLLKRNQNLKNLQFKGDISIGASSNVKHVLEKKGSKHDPSKLAKIHAKLSQKTPLEELFEATVETVKETRKSKRMPALNGEQYSQFQKKLIMEEFLSKDQVKKKIYEIIFQDVDKNNNYAKSMEKGQKIRISYDDVI